jgi:hypothetical protein
METAGAEAMAADTLLGHGLGAGRKEQRRHRSRDQEQATHGAPPL